MNLPSFCHAYESLDYPSKPFLQAHPERLAVMGRLFGLGVADVARSRVLEIGCGEGIHLIGAALTLPQSEFVGIDLSAASIARGRTTIAELKIGNALLLRGDLQTAGHNLGTFDYLIAHGVYSWVPPPVRNALLALTRRLLNPAGVAFLSYNAYPGYYLRQMAREMAGSVPAADEPGAWIQEARAWLREAPASASGSPLFRSLLATEAADLLASNDGHLLHGDLAGVNDAFYFHDFARHAAQHGLSYLAEAELGGMALRGLSPEARSTVLRFAGEDRIAREQYSDFQRGRRFRQTLLCHSGQATLCEPDLTVVANLYAGAPLSVSGTLENGTLEYTSALGGQTKTADPLTRELLNRLAAAWPEFLPVNRLAPGHPADEVANRIIELFTANLIDLRTQPPPVAIRIPTHPEASALARIQARQGNSVTSLHHFDVQLQNGSLRSLLTLLDGSRSRAALVRDLAAIYPTASQASVELAAEQHLADLYRHGLLTGN